MSIRLATIGTSTISDTLLEAATQVDGLDYIGTMSRDLHRAETFTHVHGGTTPYTELAQIIADPDVDAVYIASPNACHYKQAEELIRANKNVLVEKPICANRYEVQQLLATANLHHVISTEAIRPIHDPSWATIYAALPKLGTLRRATLRYGKYSSRYDEVRSMRHTNIFDTKLASGALMDLGIYPIEVMCALFGAPKKIQAAPIMLEEKYNEVTGGPIDGAGSVLCTYGSHRDFPGLVVEISYSKISNDYMPSQIEGDLGTITIDNLSCPTKVVLSLRGESNHSGDMRFINAQENVEEIPITPAENNIVYVLRDFVAMCNGENIDTMWGKDLDVRAAWTHFDNASVDAMTVTDEVRHQAGITFVSDYSAFHR